MNFNHLDKPPYDNIVRMLPQDIGRTKQDLENIVRKASAVVNQYTWEEKSSLYDVVFQEKLLGLTVHSDEQGKHAVVVRTGNGSAAQKVTIGSRIVSVNSKKCENFARDDILYIIKQEQNKQFPLRIKFRTPRSVPSPSKPKSTNRAATNLKDSPASYDLGPGGERCKDDLTDRSNAMDSPASYGPGNQRCLDDLTKRRRLVARPLPELSGGRLIERILREEERARRF